LAEPLYPAVPYTGYADPIEEDRHRHLLEFDRLADELVVKAAADVLVVR
jgi:hypothetical protein